jgi:hypothetical protein
MLLQKTRIGGPWKQYGRIGIKLNVGRSGCTSSQTRDCALETLVVMNLLRFLEPEPPRMGAGQSRFWVTATSLSTMNSLT